MALSIISERKALQVKRKNKRQLSFLKCYRAGRTPLSSASFADSQPYTKRQRIRERGNAVKYYCAFYFFFPLSSSLSKFSIFLFFYLKSLTAQWSLTESGLFYFVFFPRVAFAFFIDLPTRQRGGKKALFRRLQRLASVD